MINVFILRSTALKPLLNPYKRCLLPVTEVLNQSLFTSTAKECLLHQNNTLRQWVSCTMVESGWTQQNVFAECVQNMIQWFKKKDIQAGWQDRVFLKKKKKGKTGNPSAVCLFHFKNTLFNRQIQVYVTPKRSRLVGNVFMSHQSDFYIAALISD